MTLRYARSTQRVEDVAIELRDLRETVTDWTDRRAVELPIFARHCAILARLIGDMLAALDQDLAAAPLEDTGATYEACRAIEQGIAVVRRLFDWYRMRYDQRDDPALRDVLHAADRVVRSCWAPAFGHLPEPPPGPLPYVDARFDAMATVRETVPVDLMGPADSVVADFVRILPVPTIALPFAVRHASWWLAVIAHETGHHVEFDADPALREQRDAAIAAVVTDARWLKWSNEVFADVYSSLALGPAAAWTVEELVHATEARRMIPTDRYPPPAVRLALLAHAGRDGAPQESWPAYEAATDDVTVRDWFAAVPAVSVALAGLPVADRALDRVLVPRPDWFGQGGRVQEWATQLLRAQPVFIPRTDVRPAPRLLVASGVMAYRHLAATADGPVAEADRRRLHDNLLEALLTAGELGTLEEAPDATRPDLTVLSRSLVARLREHLVAAS
ncbi:hypothetical protein AB0H83_31880 [Dactylosporangium sp. NPDC050688]|uniref:hypothetical protein n=1 Tax=Dactylosporangium sp. NPDC050688 TaxID=3157217 RepID=UPI0033C38BBD